MHYSAGSMKTWIRGGTRRRHAPRAIKIFIVSAGTRWVDFPGGEGKQATSLIRLIFRIAEWLEVALQTLRLARLAHAPPVPNQLM